MNREENIVNFYMICHKLKNVIRTGWLNWHVQTENDRLESVAEHIYGTQMLALAIYSEYKEEYKDLDIMKVIFMLAIHELGEAVIGDLTQFQISKQEKKAMEMEAVHKILGGLIDGNVIEELWLEFDNHETKEAWFAHLVDKLECDIQAKIYDETGKIDLTIQDDNVSYHNKTVQNFLNEYSTDNYPFSKMWLRFGQETYNYDQPFLNVSNYVMANEITKSNENNKIK